MLNIYISIGFKSIPLLKTNQISTLGLSVSSKTQILGCNTSNGAINVQKKRFFRSIPEKTAKNEKKNCFFR